MTEPPFPTDPGNLFAATEAADYLQAIIDNQMSSIVPLSKREARILVQILGGPRKIVDTKRRIVTKRPVKPKK